MRKILLMGFILASFYGFSQIKSPKEFFGFKIGDNYKLAHYNQMLEYYDQLDKNSNRVKKIEIGKSVSGRPMLLLFISSEENIENLEKYRKISEDLARARIDKSTAMKHAKDGKAIIWIDGGMHASEKAHAQMTVELAYRAATEETDEMKKVRENVVFLLMPVMNPDGLDIVASWYYKQLGTPFETTNPPWLYHHFIGHDNNRDWFMNNMPETYHVNEVLYNQWYPQIVYNQHQTGPSWTRIFVPPFSDPVNPNIHPGITTGTNLVGTSMAHHFAVKKMSGVVSNLQYSMWWNGGGRTTPYFHNMIGILTETSHSSPTPLYYPKEKMPKYVGHGRGKLTSDGTKIFYPYTWVAGESTFRQAVDYMLEGSFAVLNHAADRKEMLLKNIYNMGKDAIEGEMHNENFAYIIPVNQWDKSEALNLVKILLQGGVEIHKSESGFTAGGKKYPENTFIAFTGQAFRPYLIDLMEKQEYPNQYHFPGGPPVAPYDLAGWTLPMQMGVEVNKVKSEFNVKASKISDINYDYSSTAKTNGKYRLSAKNNASYKAVNMLMKNNKTVKRIVNSSGENLGDFIVEGVSSNDIEKITAECHVDFESAGNVSSSSLKEVKSSKIGLYKTWVANMDEGWTRWLLRDYQFDLDSLHNNQIKSSDLSKYKAIILPSQSPSRILGGHGKGFLPDEYTGGIGLDGSLKLKEYVENGGTIIAFDKASNFVISQFSLPIKNIVDGLSDKDFFIPGSLISAKVDTKDPLTYGMQENIATSFSRSSAFDIVYKKRKREGGNEDSVKEAPKPDVNIVVNYAEDNLLMSGWALNEKKYLSKKAAMVELKFGKGKIILFGFRPQFRGQPRGTYKLLFNSLMN